jgi:hypothetical protein
MTKPNRPRTRLVAGDPYQMLAALTIAQLLDADDHRPRSRR